MDVIVAAIITTLATLAVGFKLHGGQKEIAATTQTIEVNTNARLSEALTEVKQLRDTVTKLVEALAAAQESPAIARQPIPVDVIDISSPPV